MPLTSPPNTKLFDQGGDDIPVKRATPQNPTVLSYTLSARFRNGNLEFYYSDAPKLPDRSHDSLLDMRVPQSNCVIELNLDKQIDWYFPAGIASGREIERRFGPGRAQARRPLQRYHARPVPANCRTVTFNAPYLSMPDPANPKVRLENRDTITLVVALNQVKVDGTPDDPLVLFIDPGIKIRATTHDGRSGSEASARASSSMADVRRQIETGGCDEGEQSEFGFTSLSPFHHRACPGRSARACVPALSRGRVRAGERRSGSSQRARAPAQGPRAGRRGGGAPAALSGSRRRLRPRGELGGATYPLVNAATLFLLAGRREQSRTLAGKLLERARAGGDELETPYFRGATEAEALLLLGNVAQGRAALAKAVALAPKAYEDHASTLRQFELILNELDKDDAWLDSFRPPRALHFAGNMAVSPDSEAVRRRAGAYLRKERVGFGYGALAAGADILIAQALLEEGAELHLVLPMPRERFREHSVAAFGSGWTTKFDRILERATSVRAIAGAPDSVLPLAIQLAAEVAMGSAVMQAGALMTEAVQLLILDKSAGRNTGVTGWIAAHWNKSGRRQLTIAAPRLRGRPPEPVRAAAAPVRLAAMLRIDLSDADADQVSKDLLPRLARVLAKRPKPLIPPRWTGDALLLAYATTAAAADAARAAAAALAEADGARIAGHYACARQGDDAFSGHPFLAGPATRLPARRCSARFRPAHPSDGGFRGRAARRRWPSAYGIYRRPAGGGGGRADPPVLAEALESFWLEITRAKVVIARLVRAMPFSRGQIGSPA